MGAFDEWREWWYPAMGDSVTRVEYETGDDVVAVLTGRYTPDEEERRFTAFPKATPHAPLAAAARRRYLQCR